MHLCNIAEVSIFSWNPENKIVEIVKNSNSNVTYSHWFFDSDCHLTSRVLSIYLSVCAYHGLTCIRDITQIVNIVSVMVYRPLLYYLFVCLLEHDHVKNKTNEKHTSSIVITKLASLFGYGSFTNYVITVWVDGVWKQSKFCVTYKVWRISHTLTPVAVTSLKMISDPRFPWHSELA